MVSKLRTNLIKIMPRSYYFILKVKRRLRLHRLANMDIYDIMKEDQKLYKKFTGAELNWTSLHKYTEKMQWEKLFNKDKRKSLLSDKYLVREWVADKVGEEYLIPLIGVWNTAADIPFESLPESFVLKTNCGSGDVIIVRNKSRLKSKDYLRIRCALDYYLNYKFEYNTFELHYADIQPRIIAEELIACEEEDLPDYKFLCFDGQPKYCWVDKDRYHNHKRNIYDLDWNLQKWNQKKGRKNYGNYKGIIERPENFEEMLLVAERLSDGFKHVRVDLYNIHGKIYFGEMTFTNGSGFEMIIPDDMNLQLGNMWNIECKLPSQTKMVYN